MGGGECHVRHRPRFACEACQSGRSRSPGTRPNGTPHFDHPVRTLQDLRRGSPSMLRRELLTRSSLALAAGAMGSSAGWLDAAAQDNPLEGADGLDCPAVRAQFALSDDFIHMSAMLLSSHPRP